MDIVIFEVFGIVKMIFEKEITLGIVAGIIDEMSLVDLFNQLLGTHPQQIIRTGQVVKAMILT